MPSINDLVHLKPIRSDFTSDVEFTRMLDLWEDNMSPLIVDLERIASSKPVAASFEAREDFEEAFGFWMGRQGRVISKRLSHAFEVWRSLTG